MGKEHEDGERPPCTPALPKGFACGPWQETPHPPYRRGWVSGQTVGAPKGSRGTTATLQYPRNEVPGGEAYSLVQVKANTSQGVCKFLKLGIWPEFPGPTD